MDVFHCNLEPIKCPSFRQLHLNDEAAAKFSRTIPSLAAKNAIICLMKYCSSLVNLSQVRLSLDRSTSSARQKQSTCFLYIPNCLTLKREHYKAVLVSVSKSSGCCGWMVFGRAGDVIVVDIIDKHFYVGFYFLFAMRSSTIFLRAAPKLESRQVGTERLL